MHKYIIGDMLYNKRDVTYNLIVDITRTPSNSNTHLFLYTYIDLALGIYRNEFNGFYEKRTQRVA